MGHNVKSNTYYQLHIQYQQEVFVNGQKGLDTGIKTWTFQNLDQVCLGLTCIRNNKNIQVRDLYKVTTTHEAVDLPVIIDNNNGTNEEEA